MVHLSPMREDLVIAFSSTGRQQGPVAARDRIVNQASGGLPGVSSEINSAYNLNMPTMAESGWDGHERCRQSPEQAAKKP
jgi:hypothetical protein